MERYNIKTVEKKWQDIWLKKKVNSAILDKKITLIKDQAYFSEEPKKLK